MQVTAEFHGGDGQVLRRRLGLDKLQFEFLGSPMDPLTMDQTIAVIDEALAERIRLKHVVVNVAKLVNMQTDRALHADVVSSDLINIDGMGVVWGARLAGHKVPERVAGIDLMDRVLKLCHEKGYRPYILGAKRDVLERAVANIKARYPGLVFAGYRDGYFGRDEERSVVDAIAQSKADCLFVAMSSPAKERITEQYKEELGVSFLMGVGGSIDVMSGSTKRAPDWMQKTGLEWLYRVMQEPGRMWKRYLVTNSKYLWLVLKEAVTARAP
ncbi:WecB/TagA/CpsF family glycosyltransferase [Devosia sediminis]|uniref:WecB/TagA/CpsF family glycosyltransferase n=1 Tax=Devosia sediminis TaxID=2798801 RepID=A0A934IU90_9HYPH|nr:WecB/TagA/CpsF family glycosyltransferase [Devosia sediminis]MBJ3783131.1 WecB/TagA/CpsF family glycosyltransferase [Devosia sediminis]